MRNYFLKLFLICEIFFDFFIKYAKQIMKTLHVAKFVVIFFINVRTFRENFLHDATSLIIFQKIYEKIFLISIHAKKKISL